LPPPAKPKGPAIVGTQPPAPRRPTATVSQPRGLGLPRDPSEARTQLEPKASGVHAKPRAATPPPDNTSAKLLVIASVMSMVVVVLSLAVLSKTTGVVNIQTTEPVQIQTVAPAAKVAKETPKGTSKQTKPAADLMLTLDVEPKDASLVVQPTEDGFQVKVAASGYQPETRTIEKGVTGKIAVKLEPAPKKPAVEKKKKVRRAKKKRKTAVKRGPKSDAEVFLTGSDL
jgi:hypothetical protein